MITSFRDKETEKVYHQIFSKKLPQSIQRLDQQAISNLFQAERQQSFL